MKSVVLGTGYVLAGAASGYVVLKVLEVLHVWGY